MNFSSGRRGFWLAICKEFRPRVVVSVLDQIRKKNQIFGQWNGASQKQQPLAEMTIPTMWVVSDMLGDVHHWKGDVAQFCLSDDVNRRLIPKESTEVQEEYRLLTTNVATIQLAMWGAHRWPIPNATAPQDVNRSVVLHPRKRKKAFF